MMRLIYDPPAILWPLLFLLILLVFIWAVGEQARPIFSEITKALAKSAGKNASLIFMAMAFGLAASLTALYDVFKDMDQETWLALSWPQVFAYCGKVFAPFVSGATAYVVGRSPQKSSETNAPFPTTT